MSVNMTVARTRSCSGGRANASQELLHLVEHGLGVADVRQVVAAWVPTSFAPGICDGEIGRMARIAVHVVSSLENERRDADRRQDRPDVHIRVHVEIGQRIARAVGQTLVLAPPTAERIVVDPRWRHLLEEQALTPILIDQPVVARQPLLAASPRKVGVLGRTGVAAVQDQGPRSLWVRAANRMPMGPACELPKNAADCEPTASSTGEHVVHLLFHRRELQRSVG